MHRRTLLKAIPAAGAVAATSIVTRAQGAGWRSFDTTSRLEIAQARGQVRAWMPLPLSQDTDYFKTLANGCSGNAETVEIVYDPVYRAAIASADFRPGEARPVFEVVSRFQVRERSVDAKAGAGMTASSAEQALYLQATELMPTDGIVKKTADDITRGARTDVHKARAIHEWTVENTFRDPKTRGCGMGDVRAMLEAGALSGKCADLNALFVALCRAAGVPARDVYGIRVAESPRGYKSMGRLGDISKAQHCRAEFYAQGIGWVPVDPADVRKVVLEERPNLTLTDDTVAGMRSFLFGNWEGNWLPYNYAHDLRLPGSKGAPVGFLMYPQEETADGRLDSLDPENFRYRITSREIAA